FRRANAADRQSRQAERLASIVARLERSLRLAAMSSPLHRRRAPEEALSQRGRTSATILAANVAASFRQRLSAIVRCARFCAVLAALVPLLVWRSGCVAFLLRRGLRFNSETEEKIAFVAEIGKAR